MYVFFEGESNMCELLSVGFHASFYFDAPGDSVMQDWYHCGAPFANLAISVLMVTGTSEVYNKY